MKNDIILPKASTLRSLYEPYWIVIEAPKYYTVNVFLSLLADVHQSI
jgi:hypothetical protein